MTGGEGRPEGAEPNNLTGETAGEDAVFKTDLRGGERASEPGPEIGPPDPTRPPGDDTGFGRRVLEEGSPKGHPEGWLPSNALFTEGEIFATVVVAVNVCAVLAFALTMFGASLELPEPIELHPVLSVIIGGLLVGLYVLIRRRSLRFAQMKHLRGEK